MDGINKSDSDKFIESSGYNFIEKLSTNSVVDLVDKDEEKFVIKMAKFNVNCRNQIKNKKIKKIF